MTATMDRSDKEARTIHCANLTPEKITEELLYELFLQVKFLLNLSAILSALLDYQQISSVFC